MRSKEPWYKSPRANPSHGLSLPVTQQTMTEKWAIARLDVMPSAEEFSSQIEPRNMPVVFGSCVSDWAAINKWNPHTGGLDHLQVLAGSRIVEAMLSRSGAFFYGDIRSHDRIHISFSTFINLCKGQRIQRGAFASENSPKEGCNVLKFDTTETLSSCFEANSQVYLAQVPLMNRDQEGEPPLGALLEDIYMPKFLETNSISSINFWMNMTQSRSSIHYDPHHNVLCVIAERKEVTLWPPSATPFLYPMPVYGEASNHSAVDCVKPDFKVHSRAKHAWDHCQKVTLYSGDALFIPEGWFHQVDSDDLTVAVNFWWPSSVMLAMQKHMDAYYLRRIISRLVDFEKERMLTMTSTINEDVEEPQKLDHRPLVDTREENKDMKVLMDLVGDRQYMKAASFDKYNLVGKADSFPVEDKGKNGHRRTVSLQNCCATDARSMERKPSPKEYDYCLHTEEIQSSMLACSSVDDGSSHPACPEEFAGIVEKENGGVMASQLADFNPCNADAMSSRWKLNDCDFRNRFVLQNLDSFEFHSLNVLVSSIHAKMVENVQDQCSHPIRGGDQSSNRNVEKDCEIRTFSPHHAEFSDSYCLGDDPVANILGHLRPLVLQKLLLVMVNQFPKTLEALILHGLSPLSAEILTSKFDEMDKHTTRDEQEEFYRLFYSVFDDQLASMDAILNGKESFAFLALKNIAERFLGLVCERSRT